MVPEDKEEEGYEEKRKQRLAEMEGLCKQGPSNFCRAASVWKGNRENEEKDRKWAEEKSRLLRAEKNHLKDGNPTEAKKTNYRLKMHEKIRPVPENKRAVDKSGNSPNQPKFIKLANNSKAQTGALDAQV